MRVREKLLKAVHRPLHRPFRRRTKPGAIPGTVRTDPESPPTEVHIIGYGPNEFVEKRHATLDDVAEIAGSVPVCWIDVIGLGSGDVITNLGEKFGIHPLALEDVVHVHQSAKVEAYDGRLFVVLRQGHLDERLWSEQISLFVGDKFVVSFQEQPGDCFDPIRHRIRRGWGKLRQSGPDYLTYSLIDSVLDNYFPVLEAYGHRLDKLEDLILGKSGQRAIAEIYRIRSDLLLLRRLIWPHRDAVNDFLRDEHPLVQAETRTHLRDCYDHTVQLIEVAETYRELCAGLRDLHFSLLSQRTNDVMKVLTLIATIFIPLSFIASVYGMNFDTGASPWNMPELKWVYGYPFAIGLMVLVAGGLLFYFWRRGWLGRSDN